MDKRTYEHGHVDIRTYGESDILAYGHMYVLTYGHTDMFMGYIGRFLLWAFSPIWTYGHSS